MTSELIELLQDARFRLENMGSTDDTDADLIERIMKHVDILRTSAEPDVPELVRYGISMFGNGAVETGEGEYVRYDQAAGIIGRKDADINSLEGDLCRVCNYAAEVLERAEAAEAKLAEYEKRTPVAWMYVNSDGECEQIEYDINIADENYLDPDIQLLYLSSASMEEKK